MSFYLLPINDISVSISRTVTAEEITTKLFNEKIWLFSRHAPLFSKMQKNDDILIYFCGIKRLFFYAHAVIGDEACKVLPKSSILKVKEELGLVWFGYFVPLSKVEIFSQNVPIRPILNELSFIKDKKNWGLNLRAPVVRISEDDFNLITKLGNKMLC